MKNKTHIPTDAPERQNFSKKYLVRKIEEEEAESLINDYLTHDSGPSRFDGDGPERSERREGKLS